MIAVAILLLACVFGMAGVYAIVTGCRDEHRSRRFAPTSAELQLLAEIEQWMKKQQTG